MAPLYHIVILSSNRKIFDGEVQSLVPPCELGYFGVLANHAPMITALGPGKVTLHDQSGHGRSFDSVSGGFFEISMNKAIILLDKDVSGEVH